MRNSILIPAIVATSLAGFASVPQANASPYPSAEVAVCEYLDAYPTYYGVQSMIRISIEENVDPYVFAEVVVDAVTYRCPEYYMLVKRSTAGNHSRKDYLS